MRGFLGGRGPGTKKGGAASEAMRAKMGGGPPPDQKQRLDALIQTYTDNFIKAKKRSAENVGANKEIELTKNMKQMMMILATQQLRKDVKKEKKMAAMAKSAARKEKADKARVKLMEQQEIERKNAEYAAAQNPNNKSYWFGNSE